MLEQFIDSIGWDTLQVAGGLALLAFVGFRNWPKLSAIIPTPSVKPEKITECDVIVDDYLALEALEARAERLSNQEMAKGCQIIREQWLVEGTIETV